MDAICEVKLEGMGGVLVALLVERVGALRVPEVGTTRGAGGGGVGVIAGAEAGGAMVGAELAAAPGDALGVCPGTDDDGTG